MWLMQPPDGGIPNERLHPFDPTTPSITHPYTVDNPPISLAPGDADNGYFSPPIMEGFVALRFPGVGGG